MGTLEVDYVATALFVTPIFTHTLTIFAIDTSVKALQMNKVENDRISKYQECKHMETHTSNFSFKMP